jgi:hypothetical protein
VGSTLETDGSIFEGTVDMNGLKVGGGLFMRGGAIFKGAVSLISAQVGNQLSMIGSTFEDAVDMGGVQVGSTLLMRGAAFKRPTSLIFATVGVVLDLSGAELATLDLTSTRVNGELSLRSAQNQVPKWSRSARLILRNAHVGALQDGWNREAWIQTRTITAWPSELEMEGFTYERLRGCVGGGTSEIITRDTEWYFAWLKLDPTYSSQP